MKEVCTLLMFLVLPLVGARVVGAIAQSNVSCEMVAVTVSAKNDVFMSFVDNAEANLANHDDLKSRAEAIFAAMKNHSVVQLAHGIANLPRSGEVSLDIGLWIYLSFVK
ncbi:hypothetical protein [Parasitella parasitica]|uniref:Uncharacterized protein n=1 Tax=Parasitella parasitica TaxID=35722 RepID=A0A0B7N3U1_9FUNG|nr:hypothetical protein [Parasitella parasitica]